MTGKQKKKWEEVLSIKDEACSEAEIVRSVGEAPEQYPDYEDFE